MVCQNPKISILIPTFNRSYYLKECLKSILSQTVPPAQVMVIDDGSTDDTENVCQDFAGKIEYVPLNHRGKPSAVNYGLQRVKGDYVWIFDDDDVALPDALERFVMPLEKDREYGFSYGPVYYTSTGPNGALGPVQFELRLPDIRERGLLIPLLESNFLGGGALFARSVCYKELGGFNTELLRSQDYEMAVRIARHFKGVRIPGGPTYHYRQHNGAQNPVSSDERKRKWLEYDQKFFRRLYREIPLSDYLLPGYTLEEKCRQALLQRMAIMAYKLLIPEVLDDLNKVAQLNDVSPVTDREYMIIREMMNRIPRHNAGTIYEHALFFNKLRELSRSSETVRVLRPKFLRAVLARYRNNPSFRKIPGVLARSWQMYVSSLD